MDMFFNSKGRFKMKKLFSSLFVLAVMVTLFVIPQASASDKLNDNLAGTTWDVLVLEVDAETGNFSGLFHDIYEFKDKVFYDMLFGAAAYLQFSTNTNLAIWTATIQDAHWMKYMGVATDRVMIGIIDSNSGYKYLFIARPIEIE
jgi:hypothetical protein